MDGRLFEAARTGNMLDLHQLLRENPLILNTIALCSPYNLLHVACVASNPCFVKEIIKLKPTFANDITEDGFTPMHKASANGHIEIVRELMKVDHELCRQEGKDRMTPLHSAAIKGRIDVLNEMMSACAECIRDVTVTGETVLHLAVKNSQFEAIKVMVESFRKMNMEDFFNLKDEQGNTVFHLATWRKQRQVIEILLGNSTTSSQHWLEVNIINQSSLTPLDLLLIFPREAGDREIEEILRNAGDLRSRELLLSPNQTPPNLHTLPQTGRSYNLVEYFKFKKGRDSPSEARSTLLIIALLVATATFQVGISPPGGVWQDCSNSQNPNNSTCSTKQIIAGTSVMGTLNPIWFGLVMLFNSLGFTISLSMIVILTSKFPLRFELQICMTAMFFTYNTAVGTSAPEGMKIIVTVITSILPTMIPVLMKGVRWRERKCEFHGFGIDMQKYWIALVFIEL